MFSVYYVACVSVFTVTEPAAVQTSLQQQQELCRPLCSGELGSGNDAADIDVCARHNSEVCFLGVFFLSHLNMSLPQVPGSVQSRFLSQCRTTDAQCQCDTMHKAFCVLFCMSNCISQYGFVLA